MGQDDAVLVDGKSEVGLGGVCGGHGVFTLQMVLFKWTSASHTFPLCSWVFIDVA